MTELPEVWKSLADGLQPWVVPAELYTTWKSSTINLLVQIVVSDIAANDVVEAAGHLGEAQRMALVGELRNGAARLDQLRRGGAGCLDDARMTQ